MDLTERFLSTHVPYPAFDSDDPSRCVRKLRPENVPDLLEHEENVEFRPLSREAERYWFVRMNWLRLQSLQADNPSMKTRRANQAIRVRNGLVACNLGLVHAVAHRLEPDAGRRPELVSGGWMPLIRACELFDVSRDIRFSTYATHAIQNSLLRLRRRLHVNATRHQLAPHGLDHLVDERMVAEQKMRDDAQLSRKVRAAIEELPDRQHQVLFEYFGLAGSTRPVSYTRIAKGLGLSKERVRQIAMEGLAQVRRAIGLNA